MITASIVSHDHGDMVPILVSKLLGFPEIDKIIVTINTQEVLALPSDNRIYIICNEYPKGYGTNHNRAFSHCQSEFFCVLNPDVIFEENPYPALIESMHRSCVALVAPKIVNQNGVTQDSVRKFPTPISIVLRWLLSAKDFYPHESGDNNFFAEWVGGMCMLIKSKAYIDISGFDESYYMYVEDIDICTRLWKAGYKVLVCPSAVVFHEARRASRKNLQHLRWHISGLLRYFCRYLGRFPRTG